MNRRNFFQVLSGLFASLHLPLWENRQINDADKDPTQANPQPDELLFPKNLKSYRGLTRTRAITIPHTCFDSKNCKYCKFNRDDHVTPEDVDHILTRALKHGNKKVQLFHACPDPRQCRICEELSESYRGILNQRYDIPFHSNS